LAKTPLALGVSLFLLLLIILELSTGVSVRGFRGNFRPVERKKDPGLYWVKITMHVVVWLGISLLMWVKT